jgi:ATP-dependent Clp protease ATP-binding subunit ClpA
MLDVVSEMVRVDYFASATTTEPAKPPAKATVKSKNGKTAKTLKKVKPKKVTLERIEAHLRKSIIGQDPAIEAVVRSIKLAEAGLKDPVKPVGVFLFAGYTGVGKTEMARQLAVATKMPMKRFDMSEYKESHEYAKLIGSPPGYIGYEEGGQLTDFVSKSPKSIVVFDEVDKAHPSVLNLLLNIAEEGALTDGMGMTVRFNQTIVIMTSNVGAREATKEPIGFGVGDAKNAVAHEFDAAVKAYFKPEFLGRMTAIVVFNPLTPEGINRIISLELKKLDDRCASKLRVTPTVKKCIAGSSNTSLYGARNIKVTIDRDIAVPLAEYILAHKCGKNDVITISHRKAGYAFSSKKLKS